MRKRLTYANAMATIAVALALTTGGAYAAVTIGGADVKNASLAGVDFKTSALTGADLKALTKADLRSLPAAGPAGPAGPSGPAGRAGSAGAAGTEKGATGEQGERGNAGVSPSLFAVVDASNRLVRSGEGETVVYADSPGSHVVRFGDTDITDCAFQAVVNGDDPGSARVVIAAGTTNMVFVSTSTVTGDSADRPFTLTVDCP